MTDPRDAMQPKPCPFCGGAPMYDHDDQGWNWIECSQCHVSTKAAVHAGDDCRPILAEAWNRRAALEAREEPAGWKLVPMEPTSKMEYEGQRVGEFRRGEDAIAVYRAMLAASPVAAPVEAREPAWCPVHEHYKWCEHNGGVMGPSGYASPADTQGDAQGHFCEQTGNSDWHNLNSAADAVLLAGKSSGWDGDYCGKLSAWLRQVADAAMNPSPSSVSPLGPGEDEYLSWIKELERASTESPARGGRQG